MSKQEIHPWTRMEGESSKAYECFLEYVYLGPGRSQSKLAKKLGKKASYVALLSKWSAGFDWVKRSEAYDSYQFEKDVNSRILAREKFRQELINELPEIKDILLALGKGKIPKEADVTAILDKHQEVVGTRTVVSPASMIQALKLILGLSGLVIPKSIELTGSDGDAIEVVNTKRELNKLTIDELIKLKEVLDG